MVLSLSPGPAIIKKAWHYEKYANMWRITDDLWDSWPLLLNMFERCELWQNHVSEGCYPDCDMLPLGYVGKGFGEERYTRFTKDEQITMMTLWCIFRSPLMIGAELPKLDSWTLKLITNKRVLQLLSNSLGARQIMRDKHQAIWCSKDINNDSLYLAVFNLADDERRISLPSYEIGLDSYNGYIFEELWSDESLKGCEQGFESKVLPHGAKLYAITELTGSSIS